MQRYLIHSLDVIYPRVLGTILIFAIILVGNSATILAQHADFNKIIRDWTRLDGGYVIHVEKILPNGNVNATYFNPSPINVAEAKVTTWKGLTKLFIKLQDKGYPGSTYTLYYHAEKDALAGFYYQAEMKQTFEVIFQRGKTD